MGSLTSPATRQAGVIKSNLIPYAEANSSRH
jgi:hypothetical protein